MASGAASPALRLSALHVAGALSQPPPPRARRPRVYQNNLMRIQGHDALIRRFGLLPRATTEVQPAVDAALAAQPPAGSRCRLQQPAALLPPDPPVSFRCGW